MKYYLASLFLFAFYGQLAIGQTSTNWEAKPFTDLGFAQNNNRYTEPIMDESIEFYSAKGEVHFYFSNSAIVFGQLIGVDKEEDSDEAHREGLEEREEEKHVTYELRYFKLKFNGANEETEVIPLGLKHHTVNFQNPSNLSETKRSKAYDKLVYKNIYSNIDLILELPEDGGIKYSFEVNPGGDYSDIQMEYTGADVSLQGGELKILTASNKIFADASPVSFVSGRSVNTAFNVVDNIISFSVDAYDESEKLVIDPWITALSFDEHQQAYEVDFDDNGEVTILGNLGDQLAHYDATGVLEWTWSPPTAVGFQRLTDITVENATGDIYFTNGSNGADLYRVDALGTGTLVYTFGGVGDVQENWRMYFSETNDELWIGGGVIITNPDLQRIPADFASSDSYNPLGGSGGFSTMDVVLLEMNPAEDTIYFLSCNYTPTSSDDYNNQLICVSRADPNTIVWNVIAGLDFVEASNNTYAPVLGLSGNGFNGIVCGDNYVYTYNGDVLQSHDKSTGAILESITIDQEMLTHGGIDLDICGNLYIGTDDSVYVFNETLTQIGSMVAPDTTYDLRVNGSKLYLGGYDFVAELNLEISLPDGGLNPISSPVGCGGCNGK